MSFWVSNVVRLRWKGSVEWAAGLSAVLYAIQTFFFFSYVLPALSRSSTGPPSVLFGVLLNLYASTPAVSPLRVFTTDRIHCT
jgi:hypothetical protein